MADSPETISSLQPPDSVILDEHATPHTTTGRPRTLTAKALAKLFEEKAKAYHKTFAAVQGQNAALQQGWETFCNEGHTIDGYLKLRETYSELEVLIDVYKKAAEDYLAADPSKKEDVQAKVMAELDSVNSLFKEAYSSTNAARVEIRKKKTDFIVICLFRVNNISQKSSE